MTIAITLLIMVLLLVLKGFFSGSEIGFVSADRVKLRHRAATGSKGAKLAQRLLNDPPRLLTTTLLGTNFATVALATVGTLMMADLFKGNGELIAVIVFTPLFLILGEIVPKSIYQQKANDIVPYTAYPLAFLQVLLAPLVWIFAGFAKLVARMLGGSGDPTSATRDLFHSAVLAGEKSATAVAFSKGQVRNVLRFAQQRADEAMWPISTLRRFPRTTPMSRIVDYRRQGGPRVIPLFDDDETLVTSIATVESWDILDPAITSRSIDEFFAPVKTITPDKPISEIMGLLQSEPSTIVMVTDDKGEALGLITLKLLVRRSLGVEPTQQSSRAGPGG